MAALVRAGLLNAKNGVLSTTLRSLSSTKPLNLKEIRELREGQTLIVEGLNVASPRTEILVRAEKIKDLAPVVTNTNEKPCYMCALGLDVKHTDVLILSQFVRSDGCMLPRRITGLCRRQQKKIGTMVAMAHKAGLMMNLNPPGSKRDPTRRKDHKKFNTYYDETTIFMKKIPKPVDRFKR